MQQPKKQHEILSHNKVFEIPVKKENSTKEKLENITYISTFHCSNTT